MPRLCHAIRAGLTAQRQQAGSGLRRRISSPAGIVLAEPEKGEKGLKLRKFAIATTLTAIVSMAGMAGILDAGTASASTFQGA